MENCYPQCSVFLYPFIFLFSLWDSYFSCSMPLGIVRHVSESVHFLSPSCVNQLRGLSAFLQGQGEQCANFLHPKLLPSILEKLGHTQTWRMNAGLLLSGGGGYQWDGWEAGSRMEWEDGLLLEFAHPATDLLSSGPQPNSSQHSDVPSFLSSVCHSAVCLLISLSSRLLVWPSAFGPWGLGFIWAQDEGMAGQKATVGHENRNVCSHLGPWVFRHEGGAFARKLSSPTQYFPVCCLYHFPLLKRNI